MKKEWHRLLKRQLKKLNIQEETLVELESLLTQINDAYKSYDADFYRLENILEESSQELFIANQSLKKDIQTKQVELESTQDQLDIILQQVKHIVYETNEESNFSYLNNEWEVLTGLKIKDCIGKPFADFLYLTSDDLKPKLIEFLKSNNDYFDHVCQIDFHETGKTWVKLSFKIKRDKHNVPIGSVGTIMNINELKKTELELRESQEKERKANNAKAEFLSTMSHELRTPLNGVIGITNIMLMEDHLPSQVDNLKALKFSSNNLLGLINDILDFNKIEAGKIDFENREFNINYLIDGFNATYKYNAAEKGILFKIKMDNEVPPTLIGDSMRLSQILGNLISNAIKFTEKGKVTLDVETISETSDDICLRFSVIDTGIGIEEENLKNIFEHFKQADKSTSRKYGGTGLGLTICKQLLLLQKSDLKVMSQFGKGSTFYFDLTFGKSDRMVNSATHQHLIEPSYSGLGNINVLVVEDNKMNVMVLTKFLNKWETQFDVTVNGEEAVKACQNKVYDIILMDIQMPVMDGYTATKEIKKLTNGSEKTPIVALTASALYEIRQKILTIGMVDFVSKPFNPIELYEVLKTYSKA